MRVRFFAGAAAAAGVDEEEVPLPPGASVGDLLEELGRRHGPELLRVLAACSFLVAGTAAGREGILTGRDDVDVLPPFAGG